MIFVPTDLVSLLVLLMTMLLAWITTQHYLAPCKNFPPGPWGLPIIGSFMYFGSDIHTDMMKLSKKYGDVYSLKMGSHTATVVSGVKAIQECLVQKGNDFADRPDTWTIGLFNPRCEGIVRGHFDNKWQHRRQFAHATLRSFGFGKTCMESKICEEILFLLDEFRDIQNQPINAGNIINRSVSNIICSITFGKRFKYSDPNFIFIVDILGKCFESHGKVYVLDFLPFVRPFNQSNIKTFIATRKDVEKFCKQQIDEHREVFDPNHIGDFIDACLAERTKHNSKVDFTDDQLKFMLVDIFGAGTETVVTTLIWGLLFMVLHPEIQEIVYNELDQVVGANRLPRLNDRKHLPYTEATLLEIQRIGSILPFALPHRALRDTTLGGYNIPSGTAVTILLWSIHRDPNTWPDPDKFDPMRFYDEKNNTVKKSENFMPFLQ
ncbi:cytochrome P450 2U1-like [Saccoglossus kowalevskii]|uniref:Cytochrome P450 2U1-like n=1 Tax=Saccoglossus kowalevskii TaxID=10224 RepID=A0ABM0LZ73_SACKO|nr:PREDICTED: cytochrome P450 2U1-like [Saccoglossus kowalevskii]